MRIVSLTSSRFVGGPERQMLGLACALRENVDTVFVSFSEHGLSQAFLQNVSSRGFVSHRLRYDTPRLSSAVLEVRRLIAEHAADVVVCHGYKSNIVGWFAAQLAGAPALAVSRGWTGENRKVRLYEFMDRKVLCRMRKVVCVSHAQARAVVSAGVCPASVEVIPNAISVDRFRPRDARFRAQLLDSFPATQRSNVKFVIGSAGRLSPEKGFDILIEAAAEIARSRSDLGFVLFGDGPMRSALRDQVRRLNVASQFIFPGFTTELDNFMPSLDLFVQSSYKEGLPNVLLEALAAGVPVVATDVGGSSELLDGGRLGSLVPPGNSMRLASAIRVQLNENQETAAQVAAGKRWIADHFTFEKQAAAYRTLLASLRQR